MNKDLYRTWKQADERYNEEAAWPSSEFPDAEYHYFREAGCLVLALAIMLRHFGIENEPDESKFNPYILNERLKEVGAFLPNADLMLDYISKLYPLEWVGFTHYTTAKMKSYYGTHQPFLITVPGVNAANHFIIPDIMTDGNLKVIDNAFHKEWITDYEKVYNIYIFTSL